MGVLRVLALIPDSTRKRKGAAGGGAGPLIAKEMPSENAVRLTALRTAVASAAKLPLGPDLDPDAKKAVELMPAYVRYDGNMYRHIPREVWERRKDGVEVVIVSALYGIALSREPIRGYGFSMAENLPGLGTLHGWWRQNGLPGLLASYVAKARPQRVVDLLSLEYRKAVDGYRTELEVPIEAIDFPGLGRGSQPRRGEVVADVLRGTR